MRAAAQPSASSEQAGSQVACALDKANSKKHQNQMRITACCNGMLSIVLPSKRLAELPGEVIGKASVMVFSQMANPEKRHPAKMRSRFDRCSNSKVLPFRAQ